MMSQLNSGGLWGKRPETDEEYNLSTKKKEIIDSSYKNDLGTVEKVFR